MNEQSGKLLVAGGFGNFIAHYNEIKKNEFSYNDETLEALELKIYGGLWKLERTFFIYVFLPIIFFIFTFILIPLIIYVGKEMAKAAEQSVSNK